MALTWLYVLRSAKPKSCYPMIRIISIFIFTISLCAGVSSSAYATQASAKQAAGNS
jgi:hypothetical protein